MDGEDGGEAGIPPDTRVEVYPSADRDDRDTGRLGPARDDRWSLAPQGRRVQRALAGDHKAGAVQGCVEVDEIEEQLCARPYLRAEEGHCAESETAGCACARGEHRIPCRDARDIPRLRVESVGECAQPLFEDGDVGWSRALLRAEDRRRTVRPEQRTVNVSREGDLGVGEPWIQTADIDRMKIT